jgi:hypothetical protein
VLEVEGSADDACLTNIVLSDASANPLENEVVDCLTINELAPVSGCMAEIACNYNSDATVDDGSCEYIEDCAGQCGGSAVVDECDTCDADSSNDCMQDCNGVWGGSAEEDECGVCDGGNADDLGCGCFEPGPSGCDNACGSTLENDECGVCGGDGSIADGACDCDGNVFDECGVCGGMESDSENCDDGINSFSYNQSTNQAFYFIHFSYDFNG